MGRKTYRIPVHLDTKDVTSLPDDEIKAVLRGADEIIMTGGRTLLAKILKGSRDKKLLALGLDASPVYGYYNHLTIPNIQARVDWVIKQQFLAIEYDQSIPLLRYTEWGWEIERETFARELLAGFDALLASEQTEYDMLYLKDRARDMILLLLDLVEKSADSRYIPILEAWAKIDYKKVRQRISQVIASLQTDSTHTA